MTHNAPLTPALPAQFTSKEFNRDYICRVDGNYNGLELHTAVGYTLMLDLLGDTAEKVLNRLYRCKADKFTCKPFHGVTITYYYR